MISTHILDTSTGVPASNVPVRLRKRDGGKWIVIDEGTTNADGRHAFECKKEAGIYQLLFSVDKYLKKTSKESFYLTIPVVFNVSDTGRKYHVPLLLNPFGYSTYRGS